MSHTEHGCFDECMMGPNVRVGGEDGRSALASQRLWPELAALGWPTDGAAAFPRRILNGVKGPAAVAELLGVPCPEEA